MWRGIIEEYRDFLDVHESTPVVSLFEGNTPLYKAPLLSAAAGVEIWLKYEGMNPTGSFKDRGMTMAITKAKEEGAEVVICASTGNTSAAAAAYAARAGMKAVVVIPHGKVALGKLAQTVMYGADIIEIEGNFDEALAIVRNISASHPVTLVNSVNPYRIEGQKTAAFEVCDALGESPTYLAVPVGNAGNITAYWKGFYEYRQRRYSGKLPKMLGFEAAGSAAIVKGAPIANPETIATAIRIGNPASWEQAVAAAEGSKGKIDMVQDEEILEAYRLIAKEGIFCEPASAASVAGVLKYAKKGFFDDSDKIVCVLTGNGLKDPDNAMKHGITTEAQIVPASETEVVKAIFR
jgi:threonine synthase